jgi:hypothetical protein
MTFPSPTGPSRIVQDLRRDGLRDASVRRATRKLQQGVQRKAGHIVLAPIGSLRHITPTQTETA